MDDDVHGCTSVAVAWTQGSDAGGDVVIPATELKDVCDISMGQAPVGTSYNENSEGYALLAGAGDFGELVPEPKKFTTKPTRLSKVNDLILCIRATIGDLNWSDKEYCLGRGVAGLRPIQSKLDKNYLWHFINVNKGELASKGTGSTFKQVNRSHIEGWKIPLPPLAEQKRIAAILDKADAIRRKRQQAIQLADDFLRAVFLDMFGDPVTNPKGWEVEPLSKVATVTTGNTPSRKIPEYYGDHIEWIKSDNINTPSHILTKASEYLSSEGMKVGRVVPSGSTLVTCIAGSPDCVGNAAFTNREVAFNQQINALTPKEGINKWFLYALILSSKKIIQGASTNSMKGMVSKGNMEKLIFFLPPKPLQDKFSEIFEKYMVNGGKLRVLQSESDKCFASLSQKAFAGEL